VAAQVVHTLGSALAREILGLATTTNGNDGVSRTATMSGRDELAEADAGIEPAGGKIDHSRSLAAISSSISG